MKYAWIAEHRDSFPVALMCEMLDVSASGFYESFQRAPGPRHARHARVRQAVLQVHAAAHGVYGSRKIAETLAQRDDLEQACRNTVAAAMREMGLASIVAKTFKPTTTQVDPTKQPAENKLNQDFLAEAPNRKWATDLTYLWTAAGWVYLAVVIDLFSRKVVGWSLGPSLATELVSQALRRAVESRRPNGRQLLHHSDRGCQYTSDAYQQILRALGVDCSMSRTGCCYDNAVVERFFWSLKHEWTNHSSYANLEEARLSVFKYIETFYNPVRIHETLGYRSPNQYETEHAPVQAA